MTVTYAQRKARIDAYGLDVLALIHTAIAAGDHQPDVVVTNGGTVNACYVESTQADEWFGPEVMVTTIEHDSTVIVHASRVALASHIEYTACDVCGGTAVCVPPLYLPARCGKDACRNETFTIDPDDPTYDDDPFDRLASEFCGLCGTRHRPTDPCQED